MICANCEHEQSRHKGGTDGCRRCDLGCTLFELPETVLADLEQDLDRLEATDPAVAEAAARLDETVAAIVTKAKAASCPCGDFFAGDPSDAHSAQHTAWLGRDDAHPLVVAINAATAGESPSAALRRVEQERDEALAVRKDAVDAFVRISDQLALKKAELASAQQELKELRERADRRRAEAVLQAREVSRLRQRLIAAEAAAAPAAAEVFAFDAWQCLTPGGCGARYTRRTATTNHPCGDLTPVRVTITHREDHQ